MKALRMCEVFVTTLVAGWLYSGCLAQAQNPTCPTRPFGDNTNACASTAFVQTAITSLPLAHTHIYVGNNSNIATDFGSLATFSDTGTFTVTPTSGSSQALNTSQTTTGTITAALNILTIFDADAVASPGSGFIVGWQMLQTIGNAGASALGGRQALNITQAFNSATSASNTNRQYDNLVLLSSINASDGGGVGTEKGNWTVFNPYCQLKAGVTSIESCQGVEVDVEWQATSSGLDKWGVSIVQVATDAVNGSRNSGALNFRNGVGAVGWPALITLGDTVATHAPVLSTGKIFAVYSTQVVDGGFDLLTNLTCTTYCYRSRGFAINGSGAITTGLAGTATGQVSFVGTTTGTVILTAQAAAGTPTVTFGTSSGTPAVTASSPLAITSATGNITCATCLTTSSTLNLVVGTTTIGSGTTTRILYDNAGVLGEYTLTGTGTVVAMQTAPTFITSITAPLVIGGTGAGSSLTYESTSGAGTTDFHAWLTGSQNEKMRLDTSGQLGIGLGGLTAGAKLHVGANDSSSAVITERASTDTGAPSYDFRKARGTLASPTIVSSGDTAGDFTFRAYDGGAYRRLAQITATVDGTPGASDMPGRIGFSTVLDGTITNTLRMSIFNDGGVLIGAGTTSPGAGLFAVTGMTNVATTSAVCYNTGTGLVSYDGTIGTCTVSDERLKNIGPRIDKALDKLLKINGVYYTWKDQTMGIGRQIGVGAQTVEKVFPELVHIDSEGKKSADYMRLTAPIIEALREINGRLKMLENRRVR